MLTSIALKSTRQGALLSLLLSATMVYGQTASDPTPKDSQIRKDSPSVQKQDSKKKAGGNISRADQKIMFELVSANLAEIETGRLAQTKSQNEQVKQFAQQMIDDHSKAQQELQQLAQTKGVPLPDRPNEKHRALLKKLSDMPPEKFDQQYMQHVGIADHKRTHQLLQKAEEKAEDSDLKAMVAKMTPIVKQHLQMAQGKQGEQGKSGANTPAVPATGTAGANR